MNVNNFRNEIIDSMRKRPMTERENLKLKIGSTYAR